MDADNSGKLDASDQQNSSREGEFVDFPASLTVSKLKIMPPFTVEHSYLNGHSKVISRNYLDQRKICSYTKL